MSRTPESKPFRCPACLSDAYGQEATDHPEVVLWHCRTCRHRWSELKPGQQAEPYDADYFEQTHRRWFQNPDLGLFKKLRDLMKNTPSGASVLDVGCGNGAFLRYLAGTTNSTRLVGVDLVSNDDTDRITFIQGRLETLTLDEQYDLVTSLAVIEHVEDLPAFMQFAVDHCKPGGCIAVMTVNDGGLLYSIARFLRRAGLSAAAFDRLYSKHHIHHFNSQSLRALCRRAGLEIVSGRSHNPPLAAVDVPDQGGVAMFVNRVAVAAIFSLSRVFKGGFLQTVVCRKPAASGPVL